MPNNKNNNLDAALLDQLVKAIPDYVNVIDASGTILYSNRPIKGISPEMSIGSSLFEHLVAESQVAAKACLTDALVSGKRREVEVQAEMHGERFWFLSRFIPLRDDPARRLLVVSTHVTEYHELVDALATSQRRLRDHIFNTPLAAMSLDLDLKVTEWNPAAEKLFGWTADEAIGKTPAELMLLPEQSERMNSEVQAVSITRKPMVTVYTNQDRFGNPVITRTFSTPVVDAHGEMIGVEALIEDITEYKQLIDELELSRQMISAQINNTPLAAFTWNEDHCIASWNSAAEAMFGWSAAEAVGKSFRDILIPEESIADVAEGLKRVFAGEGLSSRSGVYDLIRKDGTRLICHSFTSEIRSPDGKVILVASLVDDITERQQLIEELKASRQQLIDQLYNTPLAAIVWDSRFRVREWNAAAEELYGFSREEALGKHGYELLVKSDEREEARTVADQAFSGGDIPSRSFFHAWKKSGEKIYTENFNTPIRNGNGDLIAIATLTRDMTADIRLHDALNKARREAEEAARVKADFLSSMSHEIRTPIHGIIGATDLLMSDSLPDNIKEYVDIIQVSSRNLLDIVNNILDLSKLEAGAVRVESRVFDLHELLSSVVVSLKPLAQEKNLYIRLADDNLPGVFSGDDGKIRQIVTNLVGNAIKFTDAGGVDIAVDVGAPSYSCSQVTISVRDTGRGVPAEKKKSIFDDFSQVDVGDSRRFGGTGLGLAISQRLANLLGGSLTLESKVSEGSVFSLTVPLIVTEDAPVDMKQASLSEHRHYNKNVLLVDDNEINLSIIKRMLESFGLQVKTATNGKLAIELFSKECFDAVFMDMQMPVMDGLKAAVQIRRESNVPIIMMSANVLDVDEGLCQKERLDGFLSKPFRKSDLSSTLRDIFS